MQIERRHGLWLLILGGHAALFLASSPRPPGEQRRAASITLRIIAPRPDRTGEPMPLPHTRLATRVMPRQKTPPPAPDMAPAAATTPLASPAEPVVAETPALQPPPPASLLQSEATRRAVWQASRQPLLSERAASASQDPGRETSQARLGREIQQAGTTDCLKGEFLGGGAGLLSLPFWLVAEARGKCKH
jgi:hypothetical protein